MSCYLPSLEKEPLHRGSLESHSCCPPLITLWNSRCGGGREGLPWSMPMGGGPVFTPKSHGWRPSLLSCPASGHCLVLVQLHATRTHKVGNENWFPRAYTLYGLRCLLWVVCHRVRPADGKLLSLILTSEQFHFPTNSHILSLASFCLFQLQWLCCIIWYPSIKFKLKGLKAQK